ncbi:response regulator [Pseudaminobacter sp. NGMCC 1.201702]|uniref:response regulator n=1 Tax=Pseudaminobacter sp. NGMCC 1.201702 TaxID=3391825 RepID=UPI0039EF61A7
MSTLSGKRIFLVEDEAIVALMVEDMLAELDATVVGPALTIANGLALAQSEEIDAAVLDVNVRGERIDPVAEVLRARKVPIVFATGYGDGAGEIAREAPVLDKPYTREKLATTLARLL